MNPVTRTIAHMRELVDESAKSRAWPDVRTFTGETIPMYGGLAPVMAYLAKVDAIDREQDQIASRKVEAQAQGFRTIATMIRTGAADLLKIKNIVNLVEKI